MPRKKAHPYLEPEEDCNTESSIEQVANGSLFTTGWRPAVGWLCAFGFMLQLIIAPMFDWFMLLVGSALRAPALDTNSFMALLFALLGLGGLRTVEKLKGVK